MQLKLRKLFILQDKVKLFYKKDVTIAEFDDLKSDLNKDAPEIKSFGDLMPKTRVEAYTVIGIFLTVVGFVITALSTSSGKCFKSAGKDA